MRNLNAINELPENGCVKLLHIFIHFFNEFFRSRLIARK